MADFNTFYAAKIGIFGEKKQVFEAKMAVFMKIPSIILTKSVKSRR